MSCYGTCNKVDLFCKQVTTSGGPKLNLGQLIRGRHLDTIVYVGCGWVVLIENAAVVVIKHVNRIYIVNRTVITMLLRSLLLASNRLDAGAVLLAALQDESTAVGCSVC